jgi:hypothetical protein
MNYFTKKSIIKKRILLIYALTHILVFSKNKIIAVDPSPTAMKLDFFNLVWITFWITFLAKYLHNFFLVNFRTQSQLIELFITKNCWMLVRKYGIICAVSKSNDVLCSKKKKSNDVSNKTILARVILWGKNWSPSLSTIWANFILLSK